MNIVSYICVSLLCIFIHECWASPPPDYKSRNFDSSYENSTTNNIKSQRLENEWEYVDLAFKIDYTALNGPGQHLLNGVFLGHTIARETFATQFILDVHRAVNVSTDRLYVHNVTPATHHYEHAARYVMVSFRMYSVSNTTEEFKFSASGGSRGYGKSRNPAYSRGGGYSEDPERFNDIGSADSTPNMGYQGDLSTVEALAELSDQAQNKDSELIRMGNVTRAVDPQWGLVALDWDVSIKLAYTVGVIGMLYERRTAFRLAIFATMTLLAASIPAVMMRLNTTRYQLSEEAEASDHPKVDKMAVPGIWTISSIPIASVLAIIYFAIGRVQKRFKLD